MLNTVDFKVGDTLFIGIKCVQACSYKLKAQYVRLIDLADSERTQMRFDAYSTQLFRYYIPAQANKKNTDSILLKI